jgi:hypothetical protein
MGLFRKLFFTLIFFSIAYSDDGMVTASRGCAVKVTGLTVTRGDEILILRGDKKIAVAKVVKVSSQGTAVAKITKGRTHCSQTLKGYKAVIANENIRSPMAKALNLYPSQGLYVSLRPGGQAILQTNLYISPPTDATAPFYFFGGEGLIELFPLVFATKSYWGKILGAGFRYRYTIAPGIQISADPTPSTTGTTGTPAPVVTGGSVGSQDSTMVSMQVDVHVRFPYWDDRMATTIMWSPYQTQDLVHNALSSKGKAIASPLYGVSVDHIISNAASLIGIRQEMSFIPSFKITAEGFYGINSNGIISKYVSGKPIYKRAYVYQYLTSGLIFDLRLDYFILTLGGYYDLFNQAQNSLGQVTLGINNVFGFGGVGLVF